MILRLIDLSSRPSVKKSEKVFGSMCTGALARNRYGQPEYASGSIRILAGEPANHGPPHLSEHVGSK